MRSSILSFLPHLLAPFGVNILPVSIEPPPIPEPVILNVQDSGENGDFHACIPPYSCLRAEPRLELPPNEFASGSRLLQRVGLKKVRSRQARAYVEKFVGVAPVGFAAGAGPEAQIWVKFRQFGETAAHPLSELESGVNVRLPLETYHAAFRNGWIETRTAAGGGGAKISVYTLLDRLYRRGLHVDFQFPSHDPLSALGSIQYAVLYENGAEMPASVALLRRDDQGMFWETYYRTSELRQIQWFVSINGIVIGLKLENGALSFYSKAALASGEKRQ